jgi:hypothetical protein
MDMQRLSAKHLKQVIFPLGDALKLPFHLFAHVRRDYTLASTCPISYSSQTAFGKAWIMKLVLDSTDASCCHDSINSRIRILSIGQVRDTCQGLPLPLGPNCPENGDALSRYFRGEITRCFRRKSHLFHLC